MVNIKIKMADNMLHDWTKVVQENIEKQEINEWNLTRFFNL